MRVPAERTAVLHDPRLMVNRPVTWANTAEVGDCTMSIGRAALVFHRSDERFRSRSTGLEEPEPSTAGLRRILH